jgi:hypothetical protein
LRQREFLQLQPLECTIASPSTINFGFRAGGGSDDSDRNLLKPLSAFDSSAAWLGLFPFWQFKHLHLTLHCTPAAWHSQ